MKYIETAPTCATISCDASYDYIQAYEQYNENVGFETYSYNTDNTGNYSYPTYASYEEYTANNTYASFPAYSYTDENSLAYYNNNYSYNYNGYYNYGNNTLGYYYYYPNYTYANCICEVTSRENSSGTITT
jgi:hypothetical protein